jgi:OmpA-OmpF porin, OOP family
MKQLFTLSAILITLSANAQSLVLNWDFEDSLQCPAGSGAFVNYVADWTKPSWGSADYFYAGCPVAPDDEPPHSGNAYGGIIVYDPANIREYMTGHLSEPLVAGTTYNVSFWVCLHGSSMDAINEIGAYFTATNISNSNADPIILTPQIQGTMPYTSQDGWQLVSGSFVAAGGELYMIIGSFVDDGSMTFTEVQTTGWGDVYYYVDDVCVTTEASCTSDLGFDNSDPSSVSLYPNPASDVVRISFANPLQESFTLTLYNAQGQLVRSQSGIVSTCTEIERNGLADGIYIWHLQSTGRVLNGKLLFE